MSRFGVYSGRSKGNVASVSDLIMNFPFLIFISFTEDMGILFCSMNVLSRLSRMCPCRIAPVSGCFPHEHVKQPYGESAFIIDGIYVAGANKAYGTGASFYRTHQGFHMWVNEQISSQPSAEYLSCLCNYRNGFPGSSSLFTVTTALSISPSFKRNKAHRVTTPPSGLFILEEGILPWRHHATIPDRLCFCGYWYGGIGL